MNAQYKRDLQSNYLILEAQEEAEDYGIRMMEQNQIAGLLPLHLSRTDGLLYLNYEITGKQSLEGLFEKRFLGCEDILFVLNGIRTLSDMLQKYLLSPEKLIFDPQYLFTEPDCRTLWFCYAPGVQQDSSVLTLAEFILKRLNHQDNRAVMLGYRFFEKAQEENFSLQKSVREILAEFQEQQNPGSVWTGEGKGKNSICLDEAGGGIYADISDSRKRSNMPLSAVGGNRYTDGAKSRSKNSICPDGIGGGIYADISDSRKRNDIPSSVAGGNRYTDGVKGRSNGSIYANTEKYSSSSDLEYGSQCEVIHKTRRKKKPDGFAARLFRIVHPAVLLTTLALLAALEIVFYLGYLELTEAGGIFFFILSAELLINSYWKKAQERKDKPEPGYWGNDADDEEEDEEYENLRQEMYTAPPVQGYEQMPKMPFGKQEKEAGFPQERFGNFDRGVSDAEAVGETVCLTEPEAEADCRLVYIPDAEKNQQESKFRDILLGRENLTVGKLRERCEIILNAQTVSRLHARLEYRQGNYFVRDLNSRNGTFLNGERLNPQEVRMIEDGDRIIFSEVEYQVVLKQAGGSRLNQ